MNISPINYIHKTAFKSYTDDGIIGYDDSISEKKRNLMREHYYKWTMPFYNIYEKGHRLTNYQIALYLADLEKNHDIQKIEGTNIYRGQTLFEKPERLQVLNKKGIKTVIDLVRYGRAYQDEVENAGLDYFAYSIYENWWDTKDFEPSQIRMLVKFLQKMQEDNIYICCQNGSNDTDVALILNDFFNPMLEGKIKTKIQAAESDFPIKLNTIYDMLTKEDKKLLGWTKEFEQKLIKKLISI